MQHTTSKHTLRITSAGIHCIGIVLVILLIAGTPATRAISHPPPAVFPDGISSSEIEGIYRERQTRLVNTPIHVIAEDSNTDITADPGQEGSKHDSSKAPAPDRTGEVPKNPGK